MNWLGLRLATCPSDTASPCGACEPLQAGPYDGVGFQLRGVLSVWQTGGVRGGLCSPSPVPLSGVLVCNRQRHSLRRLVHVGEGDGRKSRGRAYGAAKGWLRLQGLRAQLRVTGPHSYSRYRPLTGPPALLKLLEHLLQRRLQNTCLPAPQTGSSASHLDQLLSYSDL